MKVIICEYHPWDTEFRIGNHHYARLFLDHGWDVAWISHPVSRFHALKKSNVTRLERASGGPFRHENGPVEIVPFTNLPFLKKPVLSSRWVLNNTHRFMTPPLVESLRSAGGFDKPDLIWLTDTVMHSVVQIAPAKAVALRIADDNIRFRNMPGSLKHIENELSKRANIIFATSSPLVDRLKSVYGEKVKLLRNGVNFDHFQGEFEKPDGLSDIEGPVAIYVGAIEEWFEPDWVEKLARERGDISVLLIGRVGIDIDRFEDLPNVHFIGPVPYEQIPAWLAHSDVAIIPFKRTPLVESVSPLKLFEFFAAGLPVVSASWTELEKLGSPATLVSDCTDFIKGVSNAVDGTEKIADYDEHKKYAVVNSWRARFDFAMSELERWLGG